MGNDVINPILRFRPWPQGDPVAPWIIDQLDKVTLIRLTEVGLELNQAVLQAQLKANAAALDIIKGAARSK